MYSTKDTSLPEYPLGDSGWTKESGQLVTIHCSKCINWNSCMVAFCTSRK